jgi:hypothetical protein
MLLATCSIFGASVELAFAAPAKSKSPPPAIDEQARYFQCMEQRLRALEEQLKSRPAAPTPASDATPPAATEPGGGTTPPAATEPPKPLPTRVVPVSGTSDPKPTKKAEPAAAAGAPAPAAGEPGKPAAPSAAAKDPCSPPPSPPPPPAAATPPEAPLLPPPPGEPAAAGNKPILGVLDSPVPGLSIGAYGEIKFGWFQNPAAGGQWQNGFDAHRIVLLPTYAITPNIIFNAELEFEHGGIAFDPDDKLHGSVDVEQIFVDFLIMDQLNWRSPGIDLIPIGYINQHHEPTQFYSVNRPELYNGLIPSTWRAPATSIFGTITDGIKYQLQLSTSLEDFGDDFGLRTDANTVPTFDPNTGLPIPYAPGITGLEALALSRPVVGDFRQLSNTMAVAGKLDFTPPFLPGLGWSVSAYYSPNTTPRGAHDDFGNLLGASSLFMVDAEFRYRIPNTWLELRGEAVGVTFGNPANLRANNDTDPTNNVGKTMYGYSGEIALHIPMGTILKSEWEAVPFFRYTYQNLQTAGFAGTDFNCPTGAGQQQFFTAGVAVFPSPKIVLKATYQHVKNNAPLGVNADYFLGGVGFFF